MLNDVPASKKAHVGVAERILAHNNFASIVNAVDAGCCLSDAIATVITITNTNIKQMYTSQHQALNLNMIQKNKLNEMIDPHVYAGVLLFAMIKMLM